MASSYKKKDGELTVAQGRVKDLESLFHRSEAELAAALSDKRSLESDVTDLRAQLAKVSPGSAPVWRQEAPSWCVLWVPGGQGPCRGPEFVCLRRPLGVSSQPDESSRQFPHLLSCVSQAEDGHAVAKKQLEKETLMRVDLENRCQSLQEELDFRKNVFEEVSLVCAVRTRSTFVFKSASL